MVHFCMVLEPSLGCFATGTEEAGGRGQSQKRDGRKISPFLEALDLNLSWRTVFGTPVATRGKAGEVERTANSLWPHLLSYILETFSGVSLSAGFWPKQYSQWDIAVLQFPFFLLLAIWPTPLPVFCMLKANPRYIIEKTIYISPYKLRKQYTNLCTCSNLYSSPVTLLPVLKPTHLKW